MKLLWDVINRYFGGKSRRRPLESRINNLTLTSEGGIRKQAGPVFVRGDHKYDPQHLIKRELEFLVRMNGCHVPRVIAAGEDWFEMEHCGIELNREHLPANWRKQIADISSALAEAGIVHRDIKAGNVLVKNEQLYLIDFGWAIWKDENPYLSPRELCLDVPREHIYDNHTALCELISKIGGNLS